MMTRINKIPTEAGAAMAISVVAIASLLMCIGLVVSMWSLYTNDIELNQITNEAAVASVNEYFAAKSDDYGARVEAAKQAAKDALVNNKLLFSADFDSQDIGVWNGSQVSQPVSLQFGVWLTEALESVSCPESNYPCFIPVNNPAIVAPTLDINAVRLNVQKEGLTETTPLYKLFKTSGMAPKISTQSTARLISRCVTYLVDISGSAHADSHNSVWWGDIPAATGLVELEDRDGGGYKVSYPVDSGLYSFPEADFDPSTSDCSKDPRSTPVGMAEGLWCSMLDERPIECADPNMVGCELHYKSDFVRLETKRGAIWVNLFSQAEPHTSFLKALNASLRLFASRRAPRDKVAIIPFAGGIISPVPATGLTEDFDAMIELTDLRRIGNMENNFGDWELTNAAHPNAYDLGWIPSVFNSGTDFLGAYVHAAQILSDKNHCAEDAAKYIVLITDGMPSHYRTNLTNKFAITTGTHLKSLDDVLEGRSKFLVNYLAASRIHTINILYGKSTLLNYVNKKVNNRFLEPIEIFSHIPDWKTFYNYTKWSYGYTVATLPDVLKLDAHCASSSKWERYLCSLKYSPISDKVKFSQNNSFFKFSTYTEGLFCPLLPRYSNPDGSVNTNCYDEDGYWTDSSGDAACVRTAGAGQYRATRNHDTTEQALECMKYAIAPNIELNG